MKKRLEADLVSIAHRILQLKDKSDINQLYLETQKLYEKLALLRFVEDHFGDITPNIGQAEIEQKIEAAFEVAKNEVPVSNTINKITIHERESTSKKILEGNEYLKTSDDDELVEEAPKLEAVQISFEELMGSDFSDDLFIKVENNSLEIPINEEPQEVIILPSISINEMELVEKVKESKTASLNEKLSKGISIDLNDRIAFTKHLFGNNPEDYKRVLYQLITFDTFLETRNFIRDMVKPDFNNWEGKEDYEERFMEIIEKKFL
jgi:hypothetical protein